MFINASFFSLFQTVFPTGMGTIHCEVKALAGGRPYFYVTKTYLKDGSGELGYRRGGICVNKHGFDDLRRAIPELDEIIDEAKEQRRKDQRRRKLPMQKLRASF